MGYRNVKFRYSSSFLIADRTEAWVLETAGRFFAAKKIARGISTISNELTLGKDLDLVDDDALNHAKSKGWCTSASDFDFTQCFSDKVMSKLAGAAERRACTTAVLSRSGRVDLSVVMSALRDHGGASPLDGLVMKMPCAHAGPWPTRTSGQTTGSLIVRSSRDDVKAWATGTSSPCISVFKPLSFSNFDAGPKPEGRYDSESLWWRHERLHRVVLADYETRAPIIQAKARAMEQRFLEGGSDAWAQHREAIDAWRSEIARADSNSPLHFKWYWTRQDRLEGIPA
jgi:secernin